MKDKPEKIVILSLDGMGTDDYRVIEDTEGFKYLKENGSFCENVRTVYPSLTYPIHASIVTGKLPRNHGIVNNTRVQPFRKNPDWFWFRKDIRGETIYDIAVKNRQEVASFLWPVTGRSRIKYNLPEIFPVKPHQTIVSQILRAGNLPFSLELDRKFGHLRRGITQPFLDDFVHESALYTFTEKNPYMTLVHYVDLDSQLHHSGFDSLEATEAVLRYGRRVNDWYSLLKEENLLEKTLFIVLSDHSHLPCHTVIRPNVFLKEMGLIRLLEDDIADYRAYFKSCDGSGYIYLDNPKDETLKKRLRDELTVLTAYEENGIAGFTDGETAGTLGADPSCAFMLEAMEGYYFDESPLGESMEKIPENPQERKNFLLSSHGYSPYKENYNPVYLMAGPGVRKNNEIPHMSVTDIGPTIAKLMGSSLWGTDGRIRYEMISHE